MTGAMKLRVWLPADLLLEEEVVRIKAQAEDGWFGLLPRHVDFTASLTPGVLTFDPIGKPEE
jgi:F-type H+-transporting ATPase subunit epsilon